MRAALALLALMLAAPAASAQERVAAAPAEAPWCTIHNPFITAVWDCSYPTRAICEATKPRNRHCVANPNWRWRIHRRVVSYRG
ncbi:MAG: DUF3551 domain-containing protein [Pseudolabrys sp.]|nr:DUF3551 domain-containing protein [Pseudolabrys sp.]